MLKAIAYLQILIQVSFRACIINFLKILMNKT